MSQCKVPNRRVFEKRGEIFQENITTIRKTKKGTMNIEKNRV